MWEPCARLGEWAGLQCTGGLEGNHTRMRPIESETRQGKNLFEVSGVAHESDRDSGFLESAAIADLELVSPSKRSAKTTESDRDPGFLVSGLAKRQGELSFAGYAVDARLDFAEDRG